MSPTLPRAFLPLVKSPRFWSDYLFLTDTEDHSLHKVAFAKVEDESDDEDSDTDYNKSDDQDSNEDDGDEFDDELSGDGDENGGEEKDGNKDDDSDVDSPNEKASNEPSSQPADGNPTEEPSENNPTVNEPASPSSSSSSSSSASDSPRPRSRSPCYSHDLTFPFARSLQPWDDTYNLSFSISPELSYFELTFCAPNLYNVSIAHDDQAHWHPWVLRWEELELVCRAVSATFAKRREKAKEAGEDEDEANLRRWEHPGLPLLFLYRFAPICVGDDVDRIVSMLVKAWKKVLGDGGTERDIRRFVERMDFRRRNFRWFKEGENWWIGVGDDAETAGAVYTYRDRDSVKSGKWRNEDWNKLVEEARAVVEDEGGLGELSEEDRELAARFAPRTKHGLSLWLQLREKDRPLHQRAGRYFSLTLDAVLRILDLGRLSSSGASSRTINGESVWTSDHMSISIHGGLERGRAIIKQMLWWIRAPLSSTLMDSSYKDLPFNIADGAEDTIPETYLGIIVPDILPTCSWLVGHTLPDSLCTALQSKEVLQDTANVSGPTSEGWLTVTTTDGGELGFNLSRFDDEELEGTGAVLLRKLTPQASAVLHALMNASGAVLTPVALAAKPLNSDVADMHWPPHRIVDAGTLHEILSGGPYQLWVKAERKEDDMEDSDEEYWEERW
ncbi:hypothetical protein B0T14DRAFT_520617 [Immersiella caudata]|uniref:Uncharacterized protein n=1 Tax=Immersiella caudata TaxID=314043 RepID=A0AA39WRP3_9PEZI|nr:hypothetical protein B0T14DRAFT_520617 [Immersiella caudata]